MKVCPKCGTQYGDDANFCTNDAGRLIALAAAPTAAATAAPTAAAPAANLVGGRFELGERVGGRHTGDVHRAIDRQTGAQVAIKLVAPALAAQPAAAQRVERELKLLERVSHPAVARVLASGRHGDRLFVATEWVTGASLADALGAGPVTMERATAIATAVGGALLDAAKVGVVHRDLAPKNVLLTAEGPKVINFPLPVPNERIAGVAGFLPPEAVEGKPIDQRSATYSLGALFYAAVTGAPPFTGEVAAILQQQAGGTVPPPSARVPLSPEIDAVIGRAMDRNPAKRHLTLKQFIDDLERAASGEPSPSTTAPFGRVGKPKELASTMLGVSAVGGNEAKTRQMDVQIPPEALREAAALEAVVAPPPPTMPPLVVPPAVIPAPVPVPAAVPVAAVPVAVPAVASAPVPVAVPVAAPPSGSPWAAPAPVASAPAVPAPVAPSQTPTVELPQQAPPPPAAPVMPARAPEAAPAGASMAPGAGAGKGQGGKRKEGGGKKKGQFRETLWFKKGDLDAAAAEEAARSGDGAAQDKVDSLPMEDRYKDDGSITSTDADRYSLRTGQTSSMPVMRDGPASSGSVSEADLIGELKGGRTKIFVAIGVAVVALVVIVLVFAM